MQRTISMDYVNNNNSSSSSSLVNSVSAQCSSSLSSPFNSQPNIFNNISNTNNPVPKFSPKIIKQQFSSQKNNQEILNNPNENLIAASTVAANVSTIPAAESTSINHNQNTALQNHIGEQPQKRMCLENPSNQHSLFSGLSAFQINPKCSITYGNLQHQKFKTEL